MTRAQHREQALVAERERIAGVVRVLDHMAGDLPCDVWCRKLGVSKNQLLKLRRVYLWRFAPAAKRPRG